MKLENLVCSDHVICVTPLAGVWIEINIQLRSPEPRQVTPLAGVWIEITFRRRMEIRIESLPLRECGLK